MQRTAPAWATILVLSLCGMVSALQFTLVIPLLPEFPDLLDISASDSSWLVTATLLTAAVGTPIIARMADMYGKRRMLLVSLGAMILGFGDLRAGGLLPDDDRGEGAPGLRRSTHRGRHQHLAGQAPA